LYVSNEQLI